MKRYKGLIIPAAVSLLSACSFDELVSLPQTPEGDGMSISFCSDMMSSVKVGTKASDPKDDAEKQINQLYIFFFGSDGEYLKGGYLSGYDNAPEEGGFYAPGQGVTMLKIANTDEHFADPALAQGATVYAVANVDETLFRDGDGDGLPDIIRNKADLDNFVYQPQGGVSLGLPAEVLIGLIPATCAVFIIPGGAQISCVAFDRTGTTKIGRFGFNHSYLIPGMVSLIASTILSLILAYIIF